MKTKQDTVMEYTPYFRQVGDKKVAVDIVGFQVAEEFL